MDGNEWESYCQKLLHMHYKDYQEVPSRFGGDLGIEGFTCSGFTFQCYCPDEDPSGKDLYELQRDKITRDIAKLIRNASKITELGAGIIKEWHFLTPIYNSKDLLSHCRLKESDVIVPANKRAASIGFTGADVLYRWWEEFPQRVSNRKYRRSGIFSFELVSGNPTVLENRTGVASACTETLHVWTKGSPGTRWKQITLRAQVVYRMYAVSTAEAYCLAILSTGDVGGT